MWTPTKSGLCDGWKKHPARQQNPPGKTGASAVVARSSGVAFALACQYAGPGHESAALQTLVAQSPWIKPNRRVVSYSDEILRREGRMNAAVSALRAKFIARRVDCQRLVFLK